MRQPSVLGDRLAAQPVHLDMVNGRVIRIRDVLAAYPARRVRAVQFLLQCPGEASRLLGRSCQDRFKRHSPLIESHFYSLHRARRQLNGVDEPAFEEE
jgi:hypothetical protein